ncbi:MAG: hypothetical protein LBD06_08940 [Candidatus Accumulibacter sp.]|nr:hypothetical protein [Accumulibacter sp.]
MRGQSFRGQRLERTEDRSRGQRIGDRRQMSLRRFAPSRGQKTERSGSLSSVLSKHCLLTCGAVAPSRGQKTERSGFLSSVFSKRCPLNPKRCPLNPKRCPLTPIARFSVI